MKVKALIVLGVFCAIIAACSTGKPSGSTPGAVFQPEWYGLQGDSDFVFTYGQAVKVSQNAAEQAAYADAMQEAAYFVDAHVQSMIKNYVEEAGINDPQVLALTSSVARIIANSRFTGTQISRRRTFSTDDGKHHTFIRVSIPVSEVKRTLHNQIRNEEALYNRFKASQAFQELDRIIEAEQ